MSAIKKSEPVINLDPVIIVEDGQVLTTSNYVAHYFDKRHDAVLRAINDLHRNVETDDVPFFRANFLKTTYTDCHNRTQPSYRMTKDGFSLLAMGFTGSIAMSYKLSYIEAFNRALAKLEAVQPIEPFQFPTSMVPAASREVVPVAKVERISGAQLRESRLLIADAKDWGLSQASFQALALNIFRKLGIDLPAADPVIPTKPEFTTTQLAEEHGLSPHVFGKRVKALKCPAHGETRLTTTSHGKQVPQFIWNDAGRRAIAATLNSSADNPVDRLEVAR